MLKQFERCLSAAFSWQIGITPGVGSTVDGSFREGG